MLIILTIFQYFLQTVTDVLDKFLITARKIEPVSYTFYTIVTGLALLLIWPWFYAPVTLGYILLSLLSGAMFSLAMYVFYLALADGEVSRVVPFVYGLVPLFDILIGLVIHKNTLTVAEFAALCLLIPGALLMGHKKGRYLTKHVGLKVLAPFLLSLYYVLWFSASHNQPVINNLMWNRIGAAMMLLPLLFFANSRRKILHADKVEQKHHTAFLFLFKQFLGGATFIFLSYLLSIGPVSVVNALQGFRYVFLFFIALALSHKSHKILEEDLDKQVIKEKILAIVLIFIGTLILFL